MEPKRVLVITDNEHILREFRKLVVTLDELPFVSWNYGFSPTNSEFLSRFSHDSQFRPVDVRMEAMSLIKEFNLIISAHCKQLFPAFVVSSVKCVNVHPGFNPYNRGWFPQVFSILNKQPLGATIHEMDEQLDHGPIIDQVQVPVYEWDTSLSAYDRVLEAELRLLRKNLPAIIRGDYPTRLPVCTGNINLKEDFQKLRHIDLTRSGTFREFYDLLRALSHGEYRNAFITTVDGRRIVLRLAVEVEDGESLLKAS